MPQSFATLAAFPQQTADRVIPLLQGLDMGHYHRFLNMMYHYTRHSGARLQWAAEHSPPADLVSFFTKLAKEEAGHYRLAEADMVALGGSIDVEHKPDPVRDFEGFWEQLGTTRYCGYLGALYVLENVGEPMQAATLQCLSQLPLQKNQVRFIMVHLQEDAAHGALTRELCEKYFSVDAEAMLKGAEQASQFWSAMLHAALKG